VDGSEQIRLLGGCEKNRLLNDVENNITYSHALLEMTTVNTSFESCSPPRGCARTHAMSQPAAVASRLFLHFTR